MNFRLGFPIVLDSENDAHPSCQLIYLGFKQIQAKEATKQIVLAREGEGDGEQLNSENPFLDENTTTIGLIHDIFFSRSLAHLRLTFECQGDYPPRKNGKIDMTSDSAGAALSVVGEVEQLNYKKDSADYDIFVSACIRDHKPNALGDPETLCIKAEACLPERKRSALLLCASDAHLLEESGFRYSSIYGTTDDLANAETFKKALGEGRRIFPLPLDDEGHWESGNKHRDAPFAKRLVEVLGFEPRRLVVEAAPPQEESSTAAVAPGSPQALFLAAVEGNDGLAAILRQQSNIPHFREELPMTSLGHVDAESAASLFDTGRASGVLPNIVIAGPTGCGKTLLSQALLFNALAVGKKGMYVAPTRALAEEVCSRLEKMLPGKDIFLSTGETGDDDWRFGKASFDIACVVNEKANVILPMNSDMLRALGVVVVDEIHMLDSGQRAGPLDMLLAKLKIAQSENSEGYPRIVVVTTELLDAVGSGGSENVTPLARYLDRDGARTLIRKAENRPQKVEHNVLFYGGQSRPEKVNIVTFASQKDRKFDEAKGREVFNLLDGYAENYRKRTSPHPEKILKEEILLNLAEEHTRFLVVGNSKEELDKLCEKACSKRKEDNRLSKDGNAENTTDENVNASKAIGNLLEKSDIPATLGQKHQDWAQYGIYLHHAEVPRELRNLAENVFASDTPCLYTPIVFCTETLSYGVNLTADGIALLNLFFYRSGSLFSGNREALTSNEYHNILGRIGRFASDEEHLPKAYVLLDCTSPTLSNEIRTLVNLYQDQGQLSSRALLKRDINNNREGNWEDLDDVSFESFRTVMDALHMAQEKERRGTVREGLVGNVLKQTFFVNSQSDVYEALKRERFIGNLLDLAANKTFFDKSLKLVLKQEDEQGRAEYQLTPCGQALINTGISWYSVAPIARWIKKLKDLGWADLPADLLLPAFLACDEVSEGMLGCMSSFRRQRRNKELSPEQESNWREKLKSAVVGQLAELLPEREGMIANLLDAIENYARGEVNFKNAVRIRVDQVYENQSTLFFLSLLAMSFDWLRGEHEEMRKYTNLDFETDREHIPQSHFEHISWAAQMCSRFFPAPNYLTPAQVADLPRLVIRLRKGVPLQYLPFAYGTRINSKQIRNMKQMKITPEEILKRHDYPQEFKKNTNAQDMPDGKEVYDTVCRFYLKQYEILHKRVARNWEDPLWDFMGQFLRENPKRAEKGKDDVRFAKICGKEMTGHVIVINGTYRIALSLGDTPSAEYDAVCILPWRQDYTLGRGEPIFTPGGLFTFCQLFSTDLLTKCRELSDNPENPSIISANTILRWSSCDCGEDALAIMEPFSD